MFSTIFDPAGVEDTVQHGHKRSCIASGTGRILAFEQDEVEKEGESWDGVQGKVVAQRKPHERRNLRGCSRFRQLWVGKNDKTGEPEEEGPVDRRYDDGELQSQGSEGQVDTRAWKVLTGMAIMKIARFTFLKTGWFKI
jgi:hypothetical protein